jgi:putative spermidine/putrescine transport system substrate-binding protein
VSNNKSNVSRRNFLQISALVTAGAAAGLVNPRLAFAQTATATPGPLPPAPAPGPIDLKAAGGMDALIEAAKKEGELSTIALPDNWADYGDIKKQFLAKYPFLKHNDLNPDAGSGDEIQAIKDNAGNKGPQNPDVVDVGFTWGDTGKKQGLFQNYKVATWDSIPDSVKDADGAWYGDYYGTMLFEVNADVVSKVPQDWADLLKPDYKGQIALGGDPTKANQAIYAIWAAGIATNGGKIDDGTAGLEFFAQLAKAGNLLPTIAQDATVGKGETPITLRWDYNALSNVEGSKKSGINIATVYPTSGTIAGVYVQAINAYAPRPNAARLWMEYLYSDEGQLTFLKGRATPIRFDDLKKRGVIPAELLASLPKTDVKVVLPSLEQINTASKNISTNWTAKVGSLLTK